MVLNNEKEIDRNLVPLPKSDGSIYIPRDELTNGDRCRKCHIMIVKEDKGICIFCKDY